MAATEKKPTTTTKATAKTASTKTATTRRTTSRRKAAPAITEAMIAERAYLISQSGEGSSDLENWLRAEAELQTA
jgi:hypothetical protein